MPYPYLLICVLRLSRFLLTMFGVERATLWLGGGGWLGDQLLCSSAFFELSKAVVLSCSLLVETLSELSAPRFG